LVLVGAADVPHPPTDHQESVGGLNKWWVPEHFFSNGWRHERHSDL